MGWGGLVGEGGRGRNSCLHDNGILLLDGRQRLEDQFKSSGDYTFFLHTAHLLGSHCSTHAICLSRSCLTIGEHLSFTDTSRTSKVGTCHGN
jgi:hypothetical protein